MSSNASLKFLKSATARLLTSGLYFCKTVDLSIFWTFGLSALGIGPLGLLDLGPLDLCALDLGPLDLLEPVYLGPLDL